MTRFLLSALFLFMAAVPAVQAKPAAAPVEKKRFLRLAPNTERHIRERHFPGGRQTRGKSRFLPDVDLDALLLLAEPVKPKRQGNGRDKRVVDAGKVIGTDGRTGKPVRRFVVISEPDGLVITAYPGD